MYTLQIPSTRVFGTRILTDLFPWELHKLAYEVGISTFCHDVTLDLIVTIRVILAGSLSVWSLEPLLSHLVPVWGMISMVRVIESEMICPLRMQSSRQLICRKSHLRLVTCYLQLKIGEFNNQPLEQYGFLMNYRWDKMCTLKRVYRLEAPVMAYWRGEWEMAARCMCWSLLSLSPWQSADIDVLTPALHGVMKYFVSSIGWDSARQLSIIHRYMSIVGAACTESVAWSWLLMIIR